ncbi:MAG: DUF6686 family protein [Chitinophagaceae bacterium]
MCQFQKLYNDENGYVVRCNKCSYYQVLFAGTMLSINREEFEKFQLQISNQKQQDDPVDQQVKNMVLPTTRPGVHLVLSPGELNQLKQMMEYAETEIKTLALLDLFREYR